MKKYINYVGKEFQSAKKSPLANTNGSLPKTVDDHSKLFQSAKKSPLANTHLIS